MSGEDRARGGEEATREELAPGRWAIGCQVRPWLQSWGPDLLAARLPELMRQLAAIGFAGFETRLACLPLDDPRGFAAMSEDAAGLRLAGAHVVGAWCEPGAAATIEGIAADAAKLPALGCRRLVVSGVPLPAPLTEGDLERLAENLRTLGQACREHGVLVAYHNHGAEIADDARVLEALVAACAPEEVMLAADLGWVAHAGMEVETFLRRFGARLAYAHVRDVMAYGPAGGFTEVGRGILDHRAILASLDEIGYRGWLTVESEFGPDWHGLADPVDSAAAQYAGLREVIARFQQGAPPRPPDSGGSQPSPRM